MKLTTVRVLAAALLVCFAWSNLGRAQNQSQLCCNPAAPHPIWAVDSLTGCGKGEVGWKHRSHCVDWQAYAQGEYIGHARTAHVHAYRLRVDDQIAFVFRLTREESSRPYVIPFALNRSPEIRNLQAAVTRPMRMTTSVANSLSNPMDRSVFRC